MSRLQLHRFDEAVENAARFPMSGSVTRSLGLVIEGYCPGAQRGNVCEVSSGSVRSLAEVVGFHGEQVVLMPLGDAKGIGMGSRIRILERKPTFKCGPELLGRVIDAKGNPLDGKPAPLLDQKFSIYSRPINPMKRARITEPLDLGVKAINGLITVGKGQRLSIMAGSGVGKSVLLGMIAKSTTADVNVFALVGERGREVREFIEEILGEEGMQRSVVVCATSDMPALVRMRAAYVATTIAEYFRSLGADVLLMMDSVTRFAMAQREVGLAAGEPPTTKGYPPSAFSLLPQLFERAGSLTSGGSITGIYTVLVDGDDINDPIGDAVRSIVDGHIVLSRKMASMNQFPAIDILNSTSRVMSQVASPEQVKLAGKLRSVLATYSEAEDLINIGAYVKGSNKNIDESVALIEGVRTFLQQKSTEKVAYADCVAQLLKCLGGKV